MNSATLILPAAEAGTVQIGDLTVNRMGFGAGRITGGGFWGEPDNVDLAKQVLKRAAELGVTFFDTADSYGPEVSECLIHDTLAPYKGLTIATKGGFTRSGPGKWRSDGSAEHLREACEGSLRRLGLPRIALYQLHAPDEHIAFVTSIKALAALQEASKIEHIGLSNVSLAQLKEALKIIPIASVQNHYNLWHRQQSEPILEFCEARGIAFIPYFPVGGGMQQMDHPALQRVAARYQATPQQVALGWLLTRSPFILPIPGTCSIDHLEDNIMAASLRLSKDDMTLLNQLSN